MERRQNMTRMLVAAECRMQRWNERIRDRMCSRKGMELVQVGILIAIAVGLGLVFKSQIGSFVNNTFGELMGADFVH